MGRAPIAMLLAVLALALVPASALGVDGDGETTFEIPLRASHGLSVKLEADDDEIQLQVRKRGQQAVYFAEGEVSPTGIAVKFARFGEFVVDYQPFRTLETHEPYRRCEGEPRTTTEGFFRGTLRFRGERGYVRVEATRVKGTLVLQPEWECDSRFASAAASRARAPEAGPDEATLVAASKGRPRVQFAVFGSREGGGFPGAGFFAGSQEITEGVGITRFTFAVTRSTGFEFDNRRGTALVDPPAPFAGTARYLRRPGAPDLWRGTLSAPLLGLGRVRLAGPGFSARMMSRLPEFE